MGPFSATLNSVGGFCRQPTKVVVYFLDTAEAQTDGPVTFGVLVADFF